MMVDYLVFTDRGLANSINVRMNNLMGFPNRESKTDNYARIIEHFSDPGTFLLIIKEVFAPKLSRQATVVDIRGELNPGQINSIKTQEELESEGAFPDLDIPQ